MGLQTEHQTTSPQSSVGDSAFDGPSMTSAAGSGATGLQLRSHAASPEAMQLQAAANASPQVAQLKAMQDCIGSSCPSPELAASSVQFNISPGTQLSEGAPLQRAVADVDYQIGNGGVQHHAGQHVGVGDNAAGGVDHSEQLSWAAVRNAVIAGIAGGNQVTVTFEVDMTVCGGCTPWFENTVWAQMNAAIGGNGGGFTLNVTVNNTTVQVNGNNTIWPNEIADVPTWNRLNGYDMMDRFITDGRDEDGDILAANPYGDHIGSIHGDLAAIVGNGIIASADIVTCFNTALVDACRLQVAAYNFRDGGGNEDAAAMQAHIRGQDDVSLFHAFSAGRIGAIPDWRDATDYADNGTRWKRALTAVFQGWYESYIDENLEDRRIQAECPHR